MKTIDFISKTAEETFGINADISDVERLKKHIAEKYGSEDQDNIRKAFASGEAAGFLTVNETYFFREGAHFRFLIDILPSFDETSLRICSAATSTGCEAYSIAMVLEAYNRARQKPLHYHIDAFDIDSEAIKTAASGIYGHRSMREDGSSLRYMASPYVKKTENGFQADSSLKENITFFVHNLMDALAPEAYHIIFCRNAFIYFSSRGRARVLANLSSALKEKGILFFGVSETARVSHEHLEPENSGDVFYFRKPG